MQLEQEYYDFDIFTCRLHLKSFAIVIMDSFNKII